MSFLDAQVSFRSSEVNGFVVTSIGLLKQLDVTFVRALLSPTRQSFLLGWLDFRELRSVFGNCKRGGAEGSEVAAQVH